MESVRSFQGAELLRHQGFVRRLARELVRDASLADDLAQEAWVWALERPPRLAGAARAWFRTVLRNLAGRATAYLRAVRLLLLAAPLFLAACRSLPAWEPVGGFTLGEVTVESPWSELELQEFERWLGEACARLAPLADYSATLETRERIEDALYPRRVLSVRIRHAPFSVFAETHEPSGEKGQSVWYDERWNDGELLAETPGFLGRIVGRVSLDPRGDLALENRRHPITDIGLLRLLEQVEGALGPALAARHPPRVRSAEATLAARPVRLVEALIPADEEGTSAMLHRFGFDRDSGLLTYYGLAELLPDGPALVEEYLYRDVRPNLGLTDADFRPEG
jgi:DNA-directed RNA polymerase specialized sigma24 family protein